MTEGNEKGREFWIQKGTPDLIGDSHQESESFCYNERCELPVIHVIEYSAYTEQQKEIERLKEKAEKLAEASDELLDELTSMLFKAGADSLQEIREKALNLNDALIEFDK